LVVANNAGFSAGAAAGLSWALAVAANARVMMASRMRNMNVLRNDGQPGLSLLLVTIMPCEFSGMTGRKISLAPGISGV
jgi:hypothetical protein